MLLSFLSLTTTAADFFHIERPRRAPTRPDGVAEAGWQVVLRAGAAARHADRVRFILQILAAALPDATPQDHADDEGVTASVGAADPVWFTTQQAATAAALLRLDERGVGGHGGLGVVSGACATCRIPLLARDIGTRQCGSGAVWDAAVTAAREALERGLGAIVELGTLFEAELNDGRVFTIPASVVASHGAFFAAECRRRLTDLGQPDAQNNPEWARDVRLWAGDLTALSGSGHLAARLAERLGDGETAGGWRRVGGWLLCPDGAINAEEALNTEGAQCWRRQESGEWLRRDTWVTGGDGEVPVPVAPASVDTEAEGYEEN